MRRQINGPQNAPFANKTDLGWLIVGDVCLGNSHKPAVLSYKTHMLDNGRTSYFSPCQNRIDVKDSLNLTAEVQGIPHLQGCIYKQEGKSPWLFGVPAHKG